RSARGSRSTTTAAATTRIRRRPPPPHPAGRGSIGSGRPPPPWSRMSTITVLVRMTTPAAITADRPRTATRAAGMRTTEVEEATLRLHLPRSRRPRSMTITRAAGLGRVGGTTRVHRAGATPIRAAPAVARLTAAARSQSTAVRLTAEVLARATADRRARDARAPEAAADQATAPAPGPPRSE